MKRTKSSGKIRDIQRQKEEKKQLQKEVFE